MADRIVFRPHEALRAMLELALARWRLRRHRPRVSGLNRTVAPLDDRQSTLVERIAFLIPRVAARVPWRADCLVQALAAERWLGSAGISTRLTFGVPRDKRADFEAHAWLTAGDRIVTGGDVGGYVPLVKP